MAPLGLSDSDVRAMLRIASRPGAEPDDGVLPWQLLRDLRDLIPCDVVSVSGQDDAQETAFADQELGDDPSPQQPEAGSDAAYWQHYWDCLDCSYPSSSGDIESVTMTSDFYSDRQYHGTGMYVEVLGPWNVEHEIKVCLPAGPRRTLRLLFFRGPGPDFTERDRAILTLLRPHLLATYVDIERRRRGPSPLTPRQRQIVQFVAAGYTNSQIAHRLALSEGTVRKHLENAFARLDVTSRSAAVARLGADEFTEPQTRWAPLRAVKG